MPENIIQPAQLAQGQMIEGEDYEYAQGSYLERLKEELAALRNQYELQREHEKETSLLGERNMAILNSALAARGTIQGMRDAHIAKLKDSHGGQANAGVFYDKENEVWRTAQGDIAKFINKNQVKDPNALSSFLGWHEGIVELTDGKYLGEEGEEDSVDSKTDAEEQTGVETQSTIGTNQSNVGGTDDDEGGVVEEVTSSIQSEKPLALDYADMNTHELMNAIDPGNPKLDPELVKEFQRRTGLHVDGKFGPNTTAAWQDAMGITVDEELGDGAPDEEWTIIENENNNTGGNNNDTEGDTSSVSTEVNGSNTNNDASQTSEGESGDDSQKTFNEMYEESVTKLKTDSKLKLDASLLNNEAVQSSTIVVNSGNTIIKDTKIIDQKLLDKNQLSEYEKLKKKYPNSIKDGF